MRRGRRRLLNGVTLVSLVLALLVAGAWVASYWHDGHLVKYDPTTKVAWGLRCANGRVEFWKGSHRPDFLVGRRKLLGIYYYSWGIGTPYWTFDRIIPSFYWHGKDKRHYGSDAQLSIPLWFIIMLNVALPFFRLFGFIRRKPLRLPGHCKTCGYDLRATPDCCPECGSVTAKDVGSASADGIVGEQTALHPDDSVR